MSLEWQASERGPRACIRTTDPYGQHANRFALSEAVDGAAKGHDVVFGIILGTGVGGGLVINQKVRTGLHAIAGEWDTMCCGLYVESYCGPWGC